MQRIDDRWRVTDRSATCTRPPWWSTRPGHGATSSPRSPEHDRWASIPCDERCSRSARPPTRPHTIPLVADVSGTFYIKPEGPQILCSPADEVPSEPCDAKPDEIDIAKAIDVINEATTLDIRHVRSSWAGLRNFVADRSPVAGFDDRLDGFFWFVGQGGYGIQMSPALAQAGASLVRSGDVARRTDDSRAGGRRPRSATPRQPHDARGSLGRASVLPAVMCAGLADPQHQGNLVTMLLPASHHVGGLVS